MIDRESRSGSAVIDLATLPALPNLRWQLKRRARGLTLAQARETPCFSCAGSPCCTHLPLHRFHVTTLAELEHALYLLNFARIELGIAASGEWSVFYHQPCRYLDRRDPKNYLCSIHQTEAQPQICVHYNPYSCWYKKALGAGSPDYVRVDRRRLAWIAERVVFNDDRVITATPGWPQLQEMVAALPFEEAAETEPEVDPVFERWLEESALAPGPRRPAALRVYGDFADRCAGCAAECCTTLVFPHGRPQTRRNVDYLQFALGFPGVGIRLPVMMGVTFASVAPMLAMIGAGKAAGATPVPAPISITGRRVASSVKAGLGRMKAAMRAPGCRPCR